MTDSKVELKGDQGATTIIRGGWPCPGLLFTLINFHYEAFYFTR